MHTTIVATPWAKLAGIVRSNGLYGAGRHLRTVALHRAHAVLDRLCRPGGKHDGTAAKVELSEVTISSSNRGNGVHYLPTPWRVLDWLHEALPQPTREWSFVDFGCGKGRVLLSAGQRPYGRVVGVEFAAELAAAARSGLAAATELRAGSVEIVEGDATRFELPATPLVVFLFNPFGPPVIDSVAANLAQSYAAAPRPIIVAYLNPLHASPFEAMQGFGEIRLPWSKTAKFAALSPYALRLFATREALAPMSAPR